MIDTLDDVEPPYRSGDSDRVERAPKWPTVGEATRRINVLIDGQAEGPAADMAARDLIVVMRELGRVTALLRRLREALVSARPYLVSAAHFKEDVRANDIVFEIDAAIAAEPASGEARPTDIEWRCVNDEPFEYAIRQGPHGDEFVRAADGACLRRAAIAAEPTSGEAEATRAVNAAYQGYRAITDAIHDILDKYEGEEAVGRIRKVLYGDAQPDQR